MFRISSKIWYQLLVVYLACYCWTFTGDPIDQDDVLISRKFLTQNTNSKNVRFANLTVSILKKQIRSLIDVWTIDFCQTEATLSIKFNQRTVCVLLFWSRGLSRGNVSAELYSDDLYLCHPQPHRDEPNICTRYRD